MSGYISKIERVNAPQNHRISVDLLLDKRTGKFFARIGGDRVEADTKTDAIRKIRERLAKVAQTEWRAVILLRVDKRDDGDENGTENGKQVFSASCSFTYARRERAQDPLDAKETIEREHTEEFEARIIECRKREAYFENTLSQKKARGDAREQEMREGRATLSDVSSPWTPGRFTEYEIPYSPEAWAGIQRISQTLRETQAKLDEFARGATPAKLAALASGDVLKLLPAAPSKKGS